jgi:hypothetical protein
MSRYQVTFERIGRQKTVPPLDVKGQDWIDIGSEIADYAKKYLGSRYYEVGIDDDMSGGHIIAGMHEVGVFKITRVEA